MSNNGCSSAQLITNKAEHSLSQKPRLSELKSQLYRDIDLST